MIDYVLPPGLVEIPFDDGGHWFSHQGCYLKSVGKILNTVYPMRPMDPWYLQRGKMIHDACCLIDTGTLDWENLDKRLAPFCIAYALFVDTAHPVVEASELIVVAPDYTYGGRLDRVLRLPGRDRLLVTDIKTGSGREERYWLQLAAYAVALDGEHVADYDFAILNVQKNGKPRLTVAPDPGAKVAEWRKILAEYLKEAPRE